jgi:hypothetical protein
VLKSRVMIDENGRSVQFTRSPHEMHVASASILLQTTPFTILLTACQPLSMY